MRSLTGPFAVTPPGLPGGHEHFPPWTGTNEDPATNQASERSGFMDVELRDGCLTIRSQAIIGLEGRLRV